MGTPPARRVWLVAGAALALVVGAAVAAFHLVTPSPPHPLTPSSEEGPEPGRPWFVDVTAAAGIDFVHFDPATDAHYIHQTKGSGVGWVDYGNGGWLDLVL